MKVGLTDQAACKYYLEAAEAAKFLSVAGTILILSPCPVTRQNVAMSAVENWRR